MTIHPQKIEHEAQMLSAQHFQNIASGGGPTIAPGFHPMRK